MELIPVALISGLFVQGPVPTTGPAGAILPVFGIPSIPRETVNRIWTEVVKVYPYMGLQLDPTGSGALFMGNTADDVVVIQPPLLQVRTPIVTDVRSAAEKVADIFTIAAHQIAASVPANLGVKLVYHATAPGGSATNFILSELVAGQDDVRTLAGAMKYDASLKYRLASDEVSYTLSVEPLYADNTLIYLDVDAQYSGVADVTHVADRISAVQSFIGQSVKSFLETRAKDWS